MIPPAATTMTTTRTTSIGRSRERGEEGRKIHLIQDMIDLRGSERHIQRRSFGVRRWCIGTCVSIGMGGFGSAPVMARPKRSTSRSTSSRSGSSTCTDRSQMYADRACGGLLRHQCS